MSELKLLKTIWEIRYEPAASLLDNRGRIADKWYKKGVFEDWSINRNYVSLTDKAKTVHFLVEYRRMYFEAEGWGLTDFCKYASAITGWVSNLLRIKNIQRVGFRNYHIVEQKSFEDTRDRMVNTLFKLNQDDWDVFGGKAIDVGFPLTLDYGEIKANFRMGAMEKAEYNPILNSDDIKQDIPEASLLIDFDMFQKQPSNIRGNNLRKSYLDYLAKTGGMMQSISQNILSHYGGFES